MFRAFGRGFVYVCVASSIVSAARHLPAQESPTPNESSGRVGPATIKVAAVQMSGYDKTERPREGFEPSQKVVEYIDRAGREGAQLVVFPEYILGRIRVPSKATRAISLAAKRHHLYVIVGCWKLDEEGGYSNAALLFGRQGQLAGTYYKTHAAVDHYEGDPPWSQPPREKSLDWFIDNDPEWKMKRGDDLPVFDLDFGRVGILTCYDGWFPESFRVLSLKGAEVLVWINGRRGSVEDFIVRSSIFQNHVAVVATNQAYGAGTMVGDWPSRILSRAADREESMITATINLARLRDVRAHSRNFQQRRPALYDSITRPLEQAPRTNHSSGHR